MLALAYEAVHKELGDSLVRAVTTASSLEAKQDSGNIIKTQSKATPNESSSQGTNSSGGPRCQDTIGDTIAQIRFESVSKYSNDLLLVRGNTLQSDEDRLKLDELMALCTTLQNRVLDLEKTKTTQHNEIASLKRRVKKLKKKDRSRTHRLERLYKGRIDAIDADEEITLVSVHDVNVFAGEEVFVAEQDVVKEAVEDEITLWLSTVNEFKKYKNQDWKRVVFKGVGESITKQTISLQQSEDKGKCILIEPMKPMNKKDLIRLDEETALNLQAEFYEEERLAREKAEKKKPILP
ncbi:hypothetical protein Tco_0407907 [Tanacetum coccineum]